MSTPFQRVTDDLTDGCGCACHTGTGYRTSCEHCAPVTPPRSDVEALARETVRRYEGDGTLAAEGLDEPNEVTLAREVSRLSERVEQQQAALDGERSGARIDFERAERAEARAEQLERERDEDYWHKRMCEYIDRLEAAEAEVERLREALRNARRDITIILSAGFDSTRRDKALLAMSNIDRALAPPDAASPCKHDWLGAAETPYEAWCHKCGVARHSPDAAPQEGQ